MDKNIQIYHDVGGMNTMMLKTQENRSVDIVNVKGSGNHKAIAVELNVQQVEDVIERLQRWVKAHRKK